MTDDASIAGGIGAVGTRRLRAVADLEIGDSACLIYEGKHEHHTVLTSFVRAGFERRQRILYIHDTPGPEPIESVLRAAGLVVDGAVARSQLVFVPAQKLYARGCVLSTDRLLDQLHAMTAMALADGWTGLRVTTEMSWVLREIGLERLLEHQGRLAAFFRGSAALGMSQLDRQTLPPAALLGALLAHPIAIVGVEPVHNFYYTHQVEAPGDWRSEATLSKWLSNLKERKRSADNLREVLQLHREIIDNAGSGIVVVDVEGRVVQCNPFMERLLGIYGLDLQGRRMADLFPDMGTETFDHALIRVLAGEVVLSQDMLVDRPGGKKQWVLATLAPYRNPDGRVIGAIASISEITARKEMEAALRASEEQLRQTQKLEAVGRLAGGVAHDMNNALNAIIAFADLALQGASDNDGLRADIGEIRTAADRAAGITRRLLAFSRRQVLQPQVVELNAIVVSVESMLRRLIGDQIALNLRLSPSAGAVRTDPSQIEQVIINLALNARDAMSAAGGMLSIETDSCLLATAISGEFDSIAPGEYAILRIFDSGCGMSPDVLSKAFEPFFTTKETTTRGSGLGLPVVYGIVKQSGGQIRVQSEIGKGTCVEVYMARAKPHVPRSEPRDAEASGHETVLLVEDEELVRKVVGRILGRAGYTVLVASGGGEALLLCEEMDRALDVLVTDVIMPGMGGKELAGRLSARFPDMKTLFITGYTDDEVLRKGILDEGRSILLKPFSPEDLLRRLREILSRG